MPWLYFLPDFQNFLMLEGAKASLTNTLVPWAPASGLPAAQGALAPSCLAVLTFLRGRVVQQAAQATNDLHPQLFPVV